MSNNFAIGGGFSRRSDTFVALGNGVIITPIKPVVNFGIQVVGTGGVATLWTALLEGSLDGVNFSTIIAHTQAIGQGITLWGTLPSAINYFRSRVSVLTLAPATDIVVYILGSS